MSRYEHAQSEGLEVKTRGANPAQPDNGEWAIIRRADQIACSGLVWKGCLDAAVWASH